jgi:alpha-ribazole phosphatase
MERLIVARHGESAYSAQGLLNGDDTVAVGLTEAGEEQARRLGRLLEGLAERLGGPVDLCVTSQMPRARETARLALDGDAAPVEVWPELNDPRAGDFEGRHLDEYRGWAWEAGSSEPAPGGGESRVEVVARYALAYRRLLERPERVVLAVLHALPIAYLLQAVDGEAPAARMDRPIEYAHPYLVDAGSLQTALDVLDGWRREPHW